MMISAPIKSSALGSKPFTDEHQNWLAVGYAFDLMNEGIRSFITREVDALHNKLFGLGLRPCTCRYDKTRRANPWHDMGICDWAKVLQTYHGSKKPKWHQSDASKWTDPLFGSWEIAKLFMSDLGKQKAVVVDASSTDTTGLLNILCWCTSFASLRPLPEKVRDVRNIDWGHNPKFELNLPQKNKAILTIEKLLNHGALGSDPDAQGSLNSIKSINLHFDAQKLQLQIIRNYMDEQTNEINDLKYQMQELESGQKKAINGLKKRITERQSIHRKLKETIPYSMPTLFFSALFLVNLCMNGIRSRYSAMILCSLMLFQFVVQLDPSSHSHERCPNEDQPLAFNVREFNFSKQLYAAKGDFVGRRWLYDEVTSTLTSFDPQILLIIGEPGSGKSAVTANLICSRTSEPTIHNNIIAYHLCQHNNKEKQEPGRFIKNVVDMIARRSRDYESFILNGTLMEVLQGRNCEFNIYKCFEEAVVIPLTKVFTNKNKLYYMVIDALDECIPEQSQHVTIIDLLRDKVNEFPKSIKVIATTRNDSIVLKSLHSSSFRQIDINTTDPRNKEDIELYIDRNLYPRINFLDKIRSYLRFSSAVPSNTKLSEVLVDISQGNFLFVKLLVEYVKSDSNTTSLMPQNLGGIYERYFRRAFPTRESFRNIRGLLEILVASEKPFKKVDIFQTIKLKDGDLDHQYFIDDLQSLSHFLRYTENNEVVLFHKSLMEWLVSEENKSIYVVSKKAGHQKLILYNFAVLENKQTPDLEELVLNLAKHIAFGDSVDKYKKKFIEISCPIVRRLIRSQNGKSVLHIAAAIDNPNMVALFIPCFQNGVDVKDSNGLTPAFISASYGLIESLKLLVNHGANVSHKANPPPSLPFVSSEDPVVTAKREFWNSSMLHVASQGGHLNVVNYLVKNNVAIDDVNGFGTTALHLAAENGHLETVKLLFKKGAQIDQLALYNAAKNGHIEVVKFFVRNNVTNNCMRCNGSYYWLKGKNRYQSLWFDIAKRFTNTATEVAQILKRIFDIGSNYSLIDDQSFLYCETPLHVAIRERHTDVARILISRSASAILCTDFTGRTPLHIAAMNDDRDIIEALVEAGARVDSTCSRFQYQEKTALNSHSFGIKKHKYLSIREEEEYFRLTCLCGWTPIHIAAQFGYTESAKLMLKYNGRLSTKSDCNGSSLIHIATCHGQHHFVQWLISYFRDVHINIPNSKNGSTPLHSAVACGHFQEASKLILEGANISALDKDGMTIIHYIMLNGDTFCLKAAITPVAYDAWSGKYETYFTNNDIRVSIKSADKAAFYLQYSDPELDSISLIIDDKCRNFMKLVSELNDPLLLVVKDNFGRTPLHMAVNRGLHCISIVLMTMMPNSAFDEELGYSIWNYILNDLVFKDDECQGRTLQIMLSFFDMFRREPKTNNPMSDLKSTTLKRMFHLYLKKGTMLKSVDKWFLDMSVPVTIGCGVPFLNSELHLLSYWPPASDTDNYFFTIDASERIPGPLAKAVANHPLGKRVINRCRDDEGYTPLHRAAQGGNILGIKEFLSWRTGIKAKTRDSHLTALDLALSFAGLPRNTQEASTLKIFKIKLNKIAFTTSLLLLDKTPEVKAICNGSATQLSIYHIAAYRGIFNFTQKLLQNSQYYGIKTVDCPDINGITPLYLAKLSARAKISTEDETVVVDDKWTKMVKMIERYGGNLRYPSSLEVEQHVLYRHLFGSYPFTFKTKIFKDLLLLYGHDPVTACYNDGVTYNWSTYSNLVVKTANSIKLKIFLGKLSTKGVLTFFKAFEDFGIESKNNDAVVKKILARHGESLALYVQTKRNFDSLDHLLDVLHEIKETFINKSHIVSKATKQENIKERAKIKLCSRFNNLLISTMLYFRSKHLTVYSKDGLSFHLYNRFLKSNFAKYRIRVTAPMLNLDYDLLSINSTDKLKTLAVGMRFLLDAILHKSPQYDYLDKLTLGISPGTRLFYQNTRIITRPEDYTIHKKSMLEVERLVNLQRNILFSLRDLSQRYIEK